MDIPSQNRIAALRSGSQAVLLTGTRRALLGADDSEVRMMKGTGGNSENNDKDRIDGISKGRARH